MPSRKQRRRRQKDLRHDYEFVYVDEEGQELDVDEVPQPSRNGRSPRSAKPGKGRQVTRGGRVVQPPSWQRAARRGLLFSPAMFALLYLLNKSANVSIYAVLFNTLILVAFFIPFGYLLDRVMYRTYLRRQGGAVKRR